MFILFIAFITVVILPILISRYLSKSVLVEVKTEVEDSYQKIDHPFYIKYTVFSKEEEIIDIIPPKISGVQFLPDPIFEYKRPNKQRVKFKVNPTQLGELEIKPAKVKLSNNQIYLDSLSNSITHTINNEP